MLLFKAINTRPLLNVQFVLKLLKSVREEKACLLSQMQPLPQKCQYSSSSLKSIKSRQLRLIMWQLKMSQFAAVTLTQLSLFTMSLSINITATSVEHPPFVQDWRDLWDIEKTEQIRPVDIFVRGSLRNSNIYILCSYLYCIDSRLWFRWKPSVFCTSALHESFPPTAPQLQRLPNGYPLVSTLWSSAMPLGWGLVCLQVCVCVHVFV